MTRAYYTLLTNDDGRWGIAFGDYDRQTVRDEREEYRENGYKAKALKIIKTTPNQWDINRAVDVLNGVAL